MAWRCPNRIIPIAVSNSGYSRCVAVESTCLGEFEDTIGIKRALLAVSHIPATFILYYMRVGAKQTLNYN